MVGWKFEDFVSTEYYFFYNFVVAIRICGVSYQL